MKKLIFFPSLFLLWFIVSANSQPLPACPQQPIFGRAENIVLVDQGLKLAAKMDTGAAMSSLSATGIKRYTKDNKQWLSFQVKDATSQKTFVFNAPLVRLVKVLKRKEEITANDKYAARPVVNLTIKLGNCELITQVNLTNRQDFRYPIIIGANTLQQLHALVDVSHQYLYGNGF